GKSASRIRNFGIRIGSKGWVGRAGARSGAGRAPRLNEAPRAGECAPRGPPGRRGARARGGDSGRAPGPSRGSPQLRRAPPAPSSARPPPCCGRCPSGGRLAAAGGGRPRAARQASPRRGVRHAADHRWQQRWLPLGSRSWQGGGRAEEGAGGARRSWGDPREGPGVRPESPPRARAPRRPGGPRGAHSPVCGASSSRGARPAPLRAPARPTQPLEPILIPKLRIRLADFPYLHCSNMLEAVHLGDLLQIWVRPGARLTPSPPDFHGPARAHRTLLEPRRFPRRGPLSRGGPIPGRPALHKEKRTLPGAPAGFSGIGCVTALGASRRPSPPLQIRGSEPDSLSIG
uniref:Uncharacterized protein n=1 Tax=Taeniopygia guttata TaxID=59729 RepID=A0A674GD58_TAEGU